MIDFNNNATFAKLAPSDPNAAWEALQGILVPDEEIHLAFRGVRDSVTFTNKRIVTLNVQGITGKKKDYTSLPYSRIQAFSVETAGIFDLDSELDLWFSGLGMVRLEFNRDVDIRSVNHFIANRVL
ncbi:PH domain-containing protein [Rhodococcus marinonascens]|uniref:PH domain-containing protein n=1 Tax=Rhodococcus marinonascens TaxID=38311 RepID=UPI0009350C47|nr:PH domain-containing protein [Rhodococcus marinonascens]